jgi:hypothetical protein
MRVLALALVAIMLVPQPLAAEPKAEVLQVADAYETLYAVMRGGIDEEAVLDNLVADFAGQLAVANPDIALLERRHQGLMLQVSEGMRPIFRTYRSRVEQEYAPRMIELLRQVLSSDEAIEITAFYRSDIGQTLLRAVSTQAVQSAGVADGIAQRDISRESTRQDIDRTTSRTLLSLSEDQMRELQAAAAATPALAKLNDYRSRALSLQTEMNNAPLTKEEEADVTRLINDIIGSRIGAD